MNVVIKNHLKNDLKYVEIGKNQKYYKPEERNQNLV